KPSGLSHRNWTTDLGQVNRRNKVLGIMKLAILTTNTLHHSYFAKCLIESYAATSVFCETDSLSAPFETAHSFENERDDYEKQLWFEGRREQISNFAAVETSSNINDPKIVNALWHLAPDVTIVFGTRKLKKTTIAACGLVLNLHGGDPQEYRGLDSHLWAIYHKDFQGLKTTLHILNDKLDDGPIIDVRALKLNAGMSIKELRAANTEVCVNLAQSALAQFEDTGEISHSSQMSQGRYYSFMPAVLKEDCVNKFHKHTGFAR
ncbi:MAG: formyltransferase family protein, partial [Opitutae bacterium]